MFIKTIESRKILNSYGNWTIETAILLKSGALGIASVPGGISKGGREVANIDPDLAIQKIIDLTPDLVSREFKTQADLDNFLITKDGTKGKSNLGGNTILSLSIAFAKASAIEKGMETYEYLHTIINPEIPLKDFSFKSPELMVLIFEGGLHGSGKASIQEFSTIVKTVDRAVELYTNVRKKLHEMKISINIGAEGAFSPDGYDNKQVLDLLIHFLSSDEEIALDIAANSFAELHAEIPDYEDLVTNFPIALIEDPYPEDDWTGWENFNRTYRADITVVTDDLTTTNPEMLDQAIKKDVGNAIIIKPNQIGTLTEVFKVIEIARKHDWKIITSHRSTDTNDDFLIDLTMGVQADYIKIGAPARGERIAKYNRLIEILKNL